MTTTLCTMCNEQPAEFVWGFPVCRGCLEALQELDIELKEEEAKDPDLKKLGDNVREAQEKWLREQDE